MLSTNVVDCIEEQYRACDLRDLRYGDVDEMVVTYPS